MPYGVLPDQKLRLEERGFQNLDTQGGLYFTLRLKFPGDWSDNELRILEKLRYLRIREHYSN